MKRNKVLLGLFVGLMTLAGGVLNAQTGRNTFYEIGPANIGGEVSSLVADINDSTRNTIFAGTSNGGLFVRTKDSTILRALYNKRGTDPALASKLVGQFDIWHQVRYVNEEGREVILPISCMTQATDGTIYLGTGTMYKQTVSNYSNLSSSGKGIYRYDPITHEFTMLFGTNGADFWAVNDIASLTTREGVTYLFAATPRGLFRWKIDAQWNNSSDPDPVFPGSVDEIKIASATRVAYFSNTGQLFKIGDVTATDVDRRWVNITSTNPAFANAMRIRMAISPSDPSHVYAMVIDDNEMMENIYLTTNGQHWSQLATSTVNPFFSTGGLVSGALAVDPQNPKRIILGGDDIWVGQGYVEGANFQWTTASSNESYLMAIPPATGDYMNRVYNSSVYVHSGIHKILPVYHVDAEGDDYHTYYIATDGGVYAGDFYSTENSFSTFENLSRGLNCAQINGIAVCPDGSIITGAANYSNPVIETHLAHVGGEPQYSWFDDGSLGNLNHDANVLFYPGSGGAVAASAFQQYAPQSRRTIFTSSSSARIGRTYADYLDYTNTTTWTTGSGFMTGDVVGGPYIGSIDLWETNTNTVFNSYVRQGIDTLGYIIRGNDTLWVNDTIHGADRGSKFQIRRGDKAIFHSRAHADYPFEYTFTSAQRAKDSVTVLNPLQSRMVAIADRTAGSMGGASIVRAVWFSWMPTDFTKVWDSAEFRDKVYDKLHFFTPIFGIRRVEGSATENLYPRNAVISNDALNVYVSAIDTKTGQSMLFRISGFENIDFSASNNDIRRAISIDNQTSPLIVDTFMVNGSYYFPRTISSLSIDPRAGHDRLVITFDDYSDNYANVAVIDNPRTNWTTIQEMNIDDLVMGSAYCALVEDSTGILYVGTEKGVYTKNGNAAWQVYENIPEMPVTAICQQTKKLPIRRNLTHTGINANNYVFAKTKWPRAIYFGTNGRGVFMDMTYVTDTINEIVDPSDYTPVSIPTVYGNGINTVSLYPNPVTTEATLAVNSAMAGTAVLRVYDLNGRLVIDSKLGYASEGENLYRIQTQNLSTGMYLVNVIIGGHTAATKMMVR